ncbi:hypothetical protein, partial [Dysosmobacter sp. HCP28S3_G4]|uniref:hypothetical protein n=1 Tax=Dysosmobacter sp. HCP28S3_G4 TaxID=3438938 RepID=UPI003F89A204
GGNGMTLPISYFRFYFPEYVLKTRLPPNCATGFLDSLCCFVNQNSVLFWIPACAMKNKSSQIKSDWIHSYT